MTLTNNNIRLTYREKQLQQILKSDERFLEFLRDKDVNRKKLVDERGRKVDVKGFVDLRKKYGLKKKDLKIVKKCENEPKKIKAEEKNSDEKLKVSKMAVTVKDEASTDTCAAPVNRAEAEDATAVDVQLIRNDKSIKPNGEMAISRDKLNVKVSPKKIKEKLRVNDFPKAEVEFRLDLEKMRKFSRKLEKKIVTETKKENEEEEADGEIHKEFTFTVSGPDEPQSDDEYSEDEDGKKNNKNKGKTKTEDKKISEAEKMDIVLLTMDMNSAKRSSQVADDDEEEGNTRSKKKRRKKLIAEEVEREVASKDFGEILSDPRFSSLMENPDFTVEEIKADAIKKRLLNRGR